MNKPDIVFIMSPMGTFTPTRSGALARYLHDCSLEALKDGLSPLVLSRSCEAEPYRDVPAHFVEYPRVASAGPGLFLHRAQRKLSGWPHFGQGVYARRVSASLAKLKLQGVPWVISNDPDLAVFLRAQYPSAYIVHIFHNQMTCNTKVRDHLATSVNKVVAVSEFTRRWVQEYYQLSEGGTMMVHNGVDTVLYHPADQEPEGTPIINFTGRTGREKAPDLYLDAAILLAQERRDFRLQMVGANHWGAVERDEFQILLASKADRLQEMGIEVRCTGHVDHMATALEYRKAHIHVTPSRWDEPFGLVTAEAMASGLATVASRTGGSPEIIAESGLLFERNDAAGLAQHLNMLVGNVQVRRDYAHRARKRSLEFTWQKTWMGLRRAAGL